MKVNRAKFSPLIQDVLYGLDRGLFDDDLGQTLMQIFFAGVGDARTNGMIQHRVRRSKLRQAFGGTAFRQPKLGDGEIVLGRDLMGRRVSVSLQYLNAHCFTVANTGAGKTMKAKFMALQIARHVRGLWLVDLRKREFRVLQPCLERVNISLHIVPGRAMRINPLQVPLGVDPADWAARVAEMLIQVLGLPPRASKLIQTTVHRLYGRFGIFEGREAFPNLYDLFEEVRLDRAANPQSRLAILDSLNPLLSSLGPEVLAYRRGWSTHDLASHHLVLELAGLAETDKDLLLNWLTMSEFSSRVARGISNPKMDLYVSCDEAQRLCGASRVATGTSALADLVGLVRGTGIGVDLSVLSVAGVAPQVPSNCATKIMGRCGSAADYDTVGRSMGLSREEIRWAQLHLKPGMFVAQLGEGRWRYPFVFTVPKMTFPPVAADNMAAPSLGALASLATVPAPEFRDWGRQAPVAVATDRQTSAVFASEHEYRFCKTVLEQPMRPSGQYAKLARMSSKTTVRVRHRLVDAGYVREQLVQTAGRGRGSILLAVTPAGREALQRHEAKEKDHGD